MFLAALFVIASNWKQPKCPSAGELINSGKSIQWNNTKQWKGAIDICNHVAISHKNYAEFKKQDMKEYILHASICIKS